jgi:arginyl-tRNA synthetase
VLIFCSADLVRRNPIIGSYQGSFKIRFNGLAGQKMIVGKRAHELVQSPPGAEFKERAGQEVSYKDFVEQIKKIVVSSSPQP